LLNSVFIVEEVQEGKETVRNSFGT